MSKAEAEKRAQEIIAADASETHPEKLLARILKLESAQGEKPRKK